MSSAAITIDSVSGYDVTWRCSGGDRELSRRLLLIDDYWMCKESSYISFVCGKTGDYVFSGKLSKKTYKPHFTASSSFGVWSDNSITMMASQSSLGAICITERDKLESTRGLIASLRSGGVKVAQESYKAIEIEVISDNLSISVEIVSLDYVVE